VCRHSRLTFLVDESRGCVVEVSNYIIKTVEHESVPSTLQDCVNSVPELVPFDLDALSIRWGLIINLGRA